MKRWKKSRWSVGQWPVLQRPVVGPLLQIAIRLALCAGVCWLVWLRVGVTVVSVAICAPLIGVALAGPFMQLCGEAGRFIRGLSMRGIEGRYYAFKGVRIEVVEDEDDVRWLKVAHLRKLVPGLPADRSLPHLYPSGWRALDRSPGGHLSADALVDLLGKASAPETLKLRHWVDQQIAQPARRVRERGGRASSGA